MPRGKVPRRPDHPGMVTRLALVPCAPRTTYSQYRRDRDRHQFANAAGRHGGPPLAVAHEGGWLLLRGKSTAVR